MRWMWVLLFVFGCAVCGLLGLTAGLNLNPASTIKFVPAWGSFGDWVSGIGALSAVVVTLWLADKQRREDVESLQIKVVMGALSNGPDLAFISVNVVSDGKRPVKITGIAFHRKGAGAALHITGFMHFGSSLPINLSYAEQADFPLEYGFERTLRQYVNAHCNGSAKGLEVVVSTSLRDFRHPVSPAILKTNQ